MLRVAFRILTLSIACTGLASASVSPAIAPGMPSHLSASVSSTGPLGLPIPTCGPGVPTCGPNTSGTTWFMK